MPPPLEDVLTDAQNLLKLESPNFDITNEESRHMLEYAELIHGLLVEMRDKWETVLTAHVAMTGQFLSVTGILRERSNELPNEVGDTCTAVLRLRYLEQTIHKACYLLFKRSQ